MLKEGEAGAKTADLARRPAVSEATMNNWKPKYGGLEVSEALCRWELEGENAKLKRLLVDKMLDNVALEDLLSKNGDARSEPGSGHSSPGMSRDERAAGVSYHRCRSQELRYRFIRDDDGALGEKLRGLACQRRRFGYRPLDIRTRRETMMINRKRPSGSRGLAVNSVPQYSLCLS